MRRLLPMLAITLVAACASPTIGPEPSLAPRAAEAIDPRLPIPDEVPTGTVDPALAGQLEQLVGEARSGEPAFDGRQAEAERLAVAAGPMASESWVVAQQSLSLLIEQYGVTTRVAANIDALASSRLATRSWITPADQHAIATAGAQVGAISERQAAAIDRVKNQLAR